MAWEWLRAHREHSPKIVPAEPDGQPLTDEEQGFLRRIGERALALAIRGKIRFGNVAVNRLRRLLRLRI